MIWPAALRGRGRGGPGPVTDAAGAPVTDAAGTPVTDAAGTPGATTAVSDVVLPPEGDEVVRQLAFAGLAMFRGEGIDLEIVRSRPNCLVVRSTVRSPLDVAGGRALVSEWLGSLPRLAHQTEGTVVESAGAPSDERRAIHTLLWSAAPTAPAEPIPMTPPAPPSPAALGSSPTDPPAGALPAPGSHGRSAPSGWLPVARGVPPPPPVARPALPEVRGDVLDDEVARDLPVVAGPSGSTWRSAVPLANAGFGSGQGAWDPAQGVGGGTPRLGRRWAWLRRRGWMLALGVVTGALGGLAAGGHATPSYSATSVLVVQSGASPSGPGSANDAEALAVTYAALIPTDQQLIDQAARALKTTPEAVSSHLEVVAESGTSLLQLHYSDATPVKAVTGANEVARLLTSTKPPGHAIPAGTVAVVTPPAGASRSGSLHKYGLPLGLLLGLLVGLVAAMVAERVDRRVDDLEGLGDGVGCPVTALPGGISPAELASALQREVDPPVTVVPMRPEQSAVATELAQELTAAWPARLHHPAAGVGPVFEEAPESLGTGDGATVVVVGAGERLAAVHEMAERLRLVGRDPAWAVLDVGAPARTVRGRGR